MKKVLFVASECVPFIKTGGLGGCCRVLCQSILTKKNFDVTGDASQVHVHEGRISKSKAGVHYSFLYGSWLEKSVCGCIGNEL